MLLAEAINIDPISAFGLLTGAGLVIAFLFKLLQSAHDKSLESQAKENARLMAELESVKKSYQEIAAEALKSATETANYYRAKEGKPPIIPLAAVIPESHSPSTAVQCETALIQSMRAEMAAIKLTLGQIPREAPEHAVEPVKPSPL